MKKALHLILEAIILLAIFALFVVSRNMVFNVIPLPDGTVTFYMYVGYLFPVALGAFLSRESIKSWFRKSKTNINSSELVSAITCVPAIIILWVLPLPNISDYILSAAFIVFFKSLFATFYKK